MMEKKKRKLLFLMHTSLDGYTADKDNSISWIKVDDEIFDFVGMITDRCDTAIYGRVTFKMMEGYWPTAAENPNASKHDKEHAAWANNATKIVFSRTLKESAWKNTVFIAGNIKEEINKLKALPGKDMLLLGSPGLAKELMKQNLIDEYYIDVNPVLLGKGNQLYGELHDKIDLELVESKTFRCGVVCLHYLKRPEAKS